MRRKSLSFTGREILRRHRLVEAHLRPASVMSIVRHKRNDAPQNTDKVRQYTEKVVLASVLPAFFIVVETFEFYSAVFRSALYARHQLIGVFCQLLA